MGKTTPNSFKTKWLEKLNGREFLNDESAQGMTEYILLIVLVVGIAYGFRERIKKMVSGLIVQADGETGSFSDGNRDPL